MNIIKRMFLVLFLMILVFAVSSCSIAKTESAEVEDQEAGEDIQEEEEETTEETQEEETEVIEEEVQKVYEIDVDIPAPSLKDNLVSEEDQQPISILLPLSYYDSDKEYPVVYYLHGYEDTIYSLYRCYSDVNKLMESGEVKEFIMVFVNGTNKLSGSFYANSPVIGNWEDHIVKDVIGYIDSNFRTIDDPGSRGIAGVSMGGSGSINIALKHPDIFSYMYAFAPGLFDENGLEYAFENSGWDQYFKNAYGAAFSPNTDIPEPYAEIPEFDGSEEDNEIVANWESGFGDLENKLNNYINKGIELKDIHIEYGSLDFYEWIIDGCKYFSGLLDDNGIEHELVETDARHSFTCPILLESMLPFFSSNF
jgi:hypothetical protein